MKKILFIMPELPGGGAEKVLIDILREFDYKNYKVTLFLIFKEGIYMGQIPAQVRVISLFNKYKLNYQRFIRWSHILGFYHLFIDTIYKTKVRKLLKKQHFDTIVSFMEGASVRLHSFIMDKASRNVSWVHIDLLTKHWSKDFFKNDNYERGIYEKMDSVAFVSNDAKEKFKKLFNYDKNNLEVVYNLIPRERIIQLAKTEKIEKQKFTITLVGRLNSQKRMDRAIEVANLLRNDGVDFQMWILGEGELHESIILQIEKYGLKDYVKLMGFKQNPYPYMMVSDIYLSTSDAEGFSLTLCEALTLGLPSVSTKCTGPREILDNGEFGILTNFEAQEIYSAIKKMYIDKNLRDKYSELAVQRSKMFDSNLTMNQIIKVIDGKS